MKKTWIVKNMESEVCNAIKQTAKDWGCTIAYVMQLTFKPESLQVMAKPLERKHSWLLHGFPESTTNKIKVNAAKENKTIAEYMQALLIRDEARQKERAEVKALLLQEIGQELKDKAKIEIRESMKAFIKTM